MVNPTYHYILGKASDLGYPVIYKEYFNGNWEFGGTWCKHKQTALAFDTNNWAVVGIFTFIKLKSVLYSHGTFVRPAWRKYGVAQGLWCFVLRNSKIKKVEVTVISDRGLSLIKSLQKLYPRIKFDIKDDGCRKLRSLSKGKAA